MIVQVVAVAKRGALLLYLDCENIEYGQESSKRQMTSSTYLIHDEAIEQNKTKNLYQDPGDNFPSY
jgi:hypothetical protein